MTSPYRTKWSWYFAQTTGVFMSNEIFANLNASLSEAGVRSGIEVLSAEELNQISAGGPFSGNEVGGGGSACTSQCHVDGNDEPGTS
jgi:hypothetical protein